jgi:glycosyltransferase 2 family protein
MAVATQPDLRNQPASAGDEESMPDRLHPRHLAVRVAQIAAVIALVAVAISALPGLGQVRDLLGNADPVWLVALALAEIGSCAGYLLVFRATFCPEMPWGLSYDIAMAELAANSLLPTGGAGGLALGVWALHGAGMGTAHIARRTVAFFLLTSAANFVGLLLVGLGMFVGLLPGRASWLLTLGPAVIAGAVIAITWQSPRLLRAFGEPLAHPGSGRWSGRILHTVRGGLTAAADGVELAKVLLRSRSFGVIVGSLAYMAFDIAALGLAFAAVGSVPLFGPLVLGYLIGQLGNLLPLPGGIGGTEAGLVGVLALYHVHVSLAAAAVLTYRLFQLVIPALLGAPAFLVLRRKLALHQNRTQVCVRLAAEVGEVPARS